MTHPPEGDPLETEDLISTTSVIDGYPMPELPEGFFDDVWTADAPATEAAREHQPTPDDRREAVANAGVLGAAAVARSFDTVRGRRFADSVKVKIGGIDATLFTITEEPLDADTLAIQSEVGAADRALSPEAARLLDFYSDERWLTHGSDRGALRLPFQPMELYLDYPERAQSMTVVLDDRPFAIDPALQSFKDGLIGEQLAAGRNLSDGANTGVATFDRTTNTITLRPVGYFDMFATQNFGADLELEQAVTVSGHTAQTIRELAGGGQLPELTETALTTNSFGIGGILKTGDGKILLCRRKGNLGVGSASGTFGFSAAGNLPWDEDLLQELSERPAHEALANRGIIKEATEELGLDTHFVDLTDPQSSLAVPTAQEQLGLQANECTVIPIGIMRDALHMGHPQFAYYLQTALTSDEVISHMLQSADAKKEYDLILAVDATPENLDHIIRNEASETGVNFNLEVRATLALLLSQENGRASLTN